jgi:hypothetical protein
MMNGFYAIYYTGATGSGVGVLAIKDGIISGADMAGGVYNGTYVVNEASGQGDANLQMTFPPGASLVTGALAGTQPLTLQMNATLPVNLGNGQPVPLQTPTGAVNVIFRKIREFS